MWPMVGRMIFKWIKFETSSSVSGTQDTHDVHNIKEYTTDQFSQLNSASTVNFTIEHILYFAFI